MGDSEDAQIMYYILHAAGNPHEVTFLQLRRVPVRMVDPANADAEELFYPPSDRAEFQFLHPLRTMPEDRVPLDAGGTLWVIHGVHLDDELAVTNHCAMEFDEFTKFLPEARLPEPRPPGPPAPRALPLTDIDKLLLENRWLELEDLMPPKLKLRRCEGGRRGDPRPRLPGDPPPLDDVVMDEPDDVPSDDDDEPTDVDMELAIVRDELAAPEDEADEYYKLRILGGGWTHKHIGVAADAAQGYARNITHP